MTSPVSPRDMCRSLRWRNLRGRRPYLGRQVFADSDETVRLAYDDAAASRCDQALGLPGAEGAAHGEQCRPGHLRKILTRQREVDLHAAVDTATRVLRQAEQRVRDAPFDALGHQLAVLA